MSKVGGETNDPEAIKDLGNRLFAKGKHHDASEQYARAIALLDTLTMASGETNEKHIYLRAVCLSNQSNCYFEMGRYESCLKPADECLAALSIMPETIDSDQVEALRCKNLLRKARAYFYVGLFDDSTGPLNEIASLQLGSKNRGYATRAQRMLQQISLYQDDAPHKTRTNVAKQPTLLRPALTHPTVEYYKYGHDHVTSALDSLDEDESADLRLETSPNLSILFAGINDGRHVFYTAMHVLDQYMSLKGGQQKKQVNVKLMCNDICCGTMARFVIFSIILHKIGSSAKCFSDLKTNDKAARWCTVMQYIFLGYGMPSWVNEMLVEVMEEIIAFPNRASFQSAYSWLPCTSDEDWERIQPVLSYWIEQAGGSSHNLHDRTWKDIPTVGDSLENYYSTTIESAEDLLERMPEHSQNYLLNKQKEETETAKLDSIEHFSDINNWPPGFKEDFRCQVGLPPDAPDEDIIKHYLDVLNQLPDEAFDKKENMKEGRLLYPGVCLAIDFVRKTKAILPPRGQCKDSVFADIYDKDESTRLNHGKDAGLSPIESKVSQADADEALKVIENTWATNPLMFDPLHYSRFASPTPHEFDPVDDFIKDFKFETYLHTPIDADAICDAMVGKAQTAISELFDWTSCYFWNAAHALVTLCEQEQVLVIEWNVGDIISTCQGIRSRQSTPLSRFHRIHASNIPDYTGTLAFFTEVVPLLHKPTPLVKTRLDISVLLNCSIWHSYAQYIFSSTGIHGLKQVEETLGVKYLGDSDDSTWLHYNHWTLSNDDREKRVSKEVFCLWLQRLFLLIALPPERGCAEVYRENCPNTVALFVRVCSFCADHLDYPTHWVSCVLDELLRATASRTLKTKAKVLTESPSDYQQQGKFGQTNEINVTSFSLDLRTQLALALKQQHKKATQSLCPLELSRLPLGSINEYQVIFPTDKNLLDPSHYKRNGFPHINCLGLVLEPTKPKAEACGGDDEYSYFMGMMQAMMPKATIRGDVLSQGSKGCQVLSCMEWELINFGESNRARFLMSSTDFEKYKYHYLSILRTDGWFRLGGPVQLRKAVLAAAIFEA